jgi:lysophospholipase L1-like esterase
VTATLGSARRRRFIVAATLLPLALVALVELALRVAGLGAAPDAAPLRFMNPEGLYADEADGPVVRDATLFWRLRPGWSSPGSNDRIGASGFRSEFNAAKEPDVRRIACLGDSNTYGLGVRADEAWPVALGRRIWLSPPFSPDAERFEVLNLGVPGYTSWQVRRFLETQGEALAPDVVIIECGAFNEWVPAVDVADRDIGRRPFWKSLRIVGLLAGAARPSAPDVDVATAKARIRDLATDGYAGPRRVPLADFEDDLRAIAAWCGAHRARVVFVSHALPADTVRRNPVATQYADVVRRVASETGAPLADAWAEFRASGCGDAELFVDFCHATQLGNELTATAVQEAMGRLDRGGR